MQVLFPVLLFGSLSAEASFTSGRELPGWRASVARRVITPEEPMLMAGYASRDRLSEGTLHDLWAKALVLEDAKGNRAVLLSFDLSGMPKSMSDRIRQRLQEDYQFSKAQILMNFSHTHSGPVLKDYLYHIYPIDDIERKKIDVYSKKFENQVVEMVGDALESLEPALLYSENGVTRFQVNRRNNKEADLHLQSELAGPNDYAVPVLKVSKPTGELIAIAFGYACHPTVLGGYLWSGDYAGFAQLDLEKKFPGATALFFQGAGGDQNPLPRRTVALAEQYGKELSVAVERVLKEEMTALNPDLKLSYGEVDLPLNDPPSKEFLDKMVQESTGHYQAWATMYSKKAERGEPVRKSYPYPVQVWKIGGQTLISLGGEPVISYAIGLKNIYGADSFIFGYSNDVMAYIPSATVLAEGGYEGASSQMAVGLPGTWKPTIETLIFHEIRKLALGLEAMP